LNGVKKEAEEIISAATKAEHGGLLARVAKAAWRVATWAPRKLFQGTKAILKTPVGLFVAIGTAMAAAGYAIKGWFEGHEQKQAEEALATAPEIGALRESIRQNQVKLEETSARLGQYNPTGHFRETVRSGGIGQGQPDI